MVETFYPATVTDTGRSQIPEVRHVAISVSTVTSTADAQEILQLLKENLGCPVGGVYNPLLHEAYFYCFVPKPRI